MGRFNLNLIITILVILIGIMQVRSCLLEKSEKSRAVPVTTTQTNVIVQPLSEAATGEGLDLQALGTLLQQAKNAEQLEQLLNQEGGINNLDLNEDGVVDFISVTEFGSGNERGFALSTQLADGVEQEIATIRVLEELKPAEKQAQVESQTQPQQAQVQIHGNPTLYGPNTYYHSRFDLGDVLLLAWLFSPHPPYYSPFAWGYYPPYYGGGYSRVPRYQYRNRTASYKGRSAQSSPNSKAASFTKSSKPQFQAKTTSPKAGANQTSPSTTAGRSRSSLSSPSRSQRSFSSSGSSKSIRSSSSLRSGSRFGGK